LIAEPTTHGLLVSEDEQVQQRFVKKVKYISFTKQHEKIHENDFCIQNMFNHYLNKPAFIKPAFISRNKFKATR